MIECLLSTEGNNMRMHMYKAAERTLHMLRPITRESLAHTLDHYDAPTVKIAHNTYVDDALDGTGTVGLTLHSTQIARFHADGTITLDTGGWHTTTTKDRLNRVEGVRITQENHEWFYVDRHGRRHAFVDGMRVTAGGEVVADTVTAS